MNAKQRIEKATREAGMEGNVYKGWDYDGAIQAFGWWICPFNATPIFLGRNVADAVGMIEQIVESRGID